MSKNFWQLCYFEFINQLKINHLIKYLFLFFVFCTLSVTFISSHEKIQEFVAIFTVISIPLALLNLSNLLFKQDLNDGTMETLSTIFSAFQITFAKWVVLFICTLLAFLTNILVVCFLYNIAVSLLLLMIICGIMLCATSSALICLISSVQSYFKTNTNFLSIVIMPLIIPSIILTGLVLQQLTAHNSYVAILIGINFILIPIKLYLSSYLIENIYNI